MRELGVGLVPYSPLGRGFLTGTVDVQGRSGRLGIPVIPIPGTKRPSRVEENVAATAIHLDDAALASLEDLGDLVVGSRNVNVGQV
jgi:aryl-alcohol dehydrogenase-like predicted oxidoreductase